MDSIRLILYMLYGYLFCLVISLAIYALTLRNKKENWKLESVETDEPENNVHIGLSIEGWPKIIGLFLATVLTLLILVWLLSLLGGRLVLGIFLLISIISIWALGSILHIQGKLDFLGDNESRRAGLIRLIISILIGSSWLLFPSWITYDAVFCIMVYASIYSIGAMRLKTLVIFLILVAIYDIWGVFITDFISRLVLEQPIWPPALLMVPVHPLSADLNLVMVLGFGDVLIPGIAILTAARHKMTLAAIIGFTIGLFAAMFAGLILDSAIPVMAFISPCLLVCMGISYYIQKRRGIGIPATA